MTVSGLRQNKVSEQACNAPKRRSWVPTAVVFFFFYFTRKFILDVKLKLILILCYLNFSQAKKDKAKQKTTKLNKRNKTVTINSRRRNDLFFESLNQDKLWSTVFLIFRLRKHLVGAWLAWKRARVERLLIESFTHQDNLHHRILWPLSSCPSNIRTYLFLRHTSVSPLKQRVNYHFKHAIFLCH